MVHSPHFGASMHLFHQPRGCRCGIWASYLAHGYLAAMPALGLTTLPEILRFVPMAQGCPLLGMPPLPQPSQTSLQLEKARAQL